MVDYRSSVQMFSAFVYMCVPVSLCAWVYVCVCRMSVYICVYVKENEEG